MSSAAPASPVSSKWGFYCLANDAVVEWAIALFASLERFAPSVPLLVIPYDDQQVILQRRLEQFGYGYLESPEIERLHRLGQRFYGDDDFSARGFRKLAAFSGPFDHFILLDSDVLLLACLDDLCAPIEQAEVDIVHFDTDPDQVYRPGSLRESLASSDRLVGFNAGLFAARSGLLDSATLARALGDFGVDWRRELVPNAEQPFLNVAAARLELRMLPAHELASGFCSTCWPAVGRLEFDGLGWRLRDSGRWDEGRRFRFAHWAGYKLGPHMPNRDLWESFRNAAER